MKLLHSLQICDILDPYRLQICDIIAPYSFQICDVGHSGTSANNIRSVIFLKDLHLFDISVIIYLFFLHIGHLGGCL